MGCVADSSPDYITGFCLGKPPVSPDVSSTANLLSLSNPHFLLVGACGRRLLVPDAHHVLTLAYLRDFPHKKTANPVSLHCPHLHRMLTRECLFRGVCYPSLLEPPPSRYSAWEGAVYSASNGVFFRCRLDRDPRLRVPPTTVRQVCPRFMSLDLYRRICLPRVPFLGALGFDEKWGRWDPGRVHFPLDPNPCRLCLGLRYLSKEKRNLASTPAISSKIWQGLVSSLPHDIPRCRALRLVRRRTIVNHYPFLLFWSVVAIPTVYWIAVVEVGVIIGNDETFSLTFGQVIPLYILVFSSLRS